MRNTLVKFKFFQSVLKLGLIVGLLVMIAHVVVLITGSKLYVAEWLNNCGLIPFVALLSATFALNLCYRFKAMAIYNYLVSNCIILQRFNIFGDHIMLARWIVLFLGLAIFFDTILFWIYEQTWNRRKETYCGFSS